MKERGRYPLIHKKFVHNDPDVFHEKELSLHDCVADQIVFENGVLYFHLPDGLWVTPHHRGNTCEKVVRSGEALVKFSVQDIDDITVDVLTRNPWTRKTNVEFGDMEQLISAINSGKSTIEFIAQYRTHFEQLWRCAIKSKKKTYYRECQLHLPKTEATFCWNELRPEYEW